MNRGQLARDDAGRQREAAADGGVEPFADDIDPAVVEMPVGHHVREAREEFTEERHQEVAAEGMAHADLERAGRIFVDAADAGHGGLQPTPAGPRPGAGMLAAFGQCQPTGAALEQAHAEVAFEARHVLADTVAGVRPRMRAAAEKLPRSAVPA